MSSCSPDLSVIIPFFNEAQNVRSLLAELRHTISILGTETEVLCVDDGSVDATFEELTSIANAWSAVRIERFAVNQGQAAALWWGFQNARGTWIAMLDGDGQNPPGELPRLWALRDEAHMVVGARIRRKDSQLRRVISRIANLTFRLLLRGSVSDAGCSLKLFRREVVKCFFPIRTLYSFLPTFAAAAGWTIIEIPVVHRARIAGASKYGLRVLAITLLDLFAVSWISRRTLCDPLAKV